MTRDSFLKAFLVNNLILKYSLRAARGCILRSNILPWSPDLFRRPLLFGGNTIYL